MVDKKSQKVFDQVKDDSSSLCVLCDSASFVTKRTKTTTTTSRLSMNFAFDNELLQHRAYKSTFRSLLRRAAARQSHESSDKAPKMTEEDIEQAERNAAIDREIKEDSRMLRREMKILALGSDAPKVIEQLRTIHLNGCTQEKRSLYSMTIHKHLLSELRFAMNAVAAVDVKTKDDPEFAGHKQVLDSRRSDGAISDGFDSDTRKTLRWCAEYCNNHYYILDESES